MTVYCEDCAHFFRVNKSDPPWRALCMKHRNEGGFGFVSKDLWDVEAPYLRCVDVNLKGTCPLYEERKEDGDEG